MEANFEVRNPEVEERLKEIGELIRAATPEGFGFALIIASLDSGPTGAMFYASNIERQGFCNMMREFLAKHEPN